MRSSQTVGIALIIYAIFVMIVGIGIGAMIGPLHPELPTKFWIGWSVGGAVVSMLVGMLVVGELNRMDWR